MYKIDEMKSTTKQKHSTINIVIILGVIFLLIPLPVASLTDTDLQDEEFALAIFSGFGYTLYIDNSKRDENLTVNHTAFGKGIFTGDVVRNDSKIIIVPSGSMLIKTVHPVFCFHPFVDITVSLSAENKTITRNGLQLFSKFHIFVSGPRIV